MDTAMVEQALKALAEIGAVRPSVPETVNTAPATPSRAEECGSPQCAGCYDVGDGKKIHPPKCRKDYGKWLTDWPPKGKAQGSPAWEPISEGENPSVAI